MTTGIDGLDGLLKGILPGDNIVWQVDAVEDYVAFAAPYCKAAKRSERRLIYFRFAKHQPLLPGDFGAEVHQLRPEDGFESFIANIHGVIEEAGRGAFYVFDCLSDLAVDWYSDQMLANFFMLTCPYLYDLETVTYFGLLRNRHSPYATGAIAETTQLLLDVYRHEGTLYVRPLKVQHRHSATMEMLHVWEGDEFKPVTSSAVVSEVLTSGKWGGGLHSQINIGSWGRAFIQAEELLDSIRRGSVPPEAEKPLLDRLLRMVISAVGRRWECCWPEPFSAGTANGLPRPSRPTTPSSSGRTSSTPTWSATAFGGYDRTSGIRKRSSTGLIRPGRTS
jgi:hypothetical protein